MATKTITVPVLDEHCEPAWEVALLFPAQGDWQEDDYLWLTDRTRRFVEFTDGHIEVLTMPTEEHQRIVLCLYRMLYAFLHSRRHSLILVAPLRLRLPSGRYREPDVLVLLSSQDVRRNNRFWTGADLVIEVVSPDDPQRDLVQKRHEYAQAGIPEYWIVDPTAAQVLVLYLQEGMYVEHGAFVRGTQVTSVLLEGLQVAVAAILDAV